MSSFSTLTYHVGPSACPPPPSSSSGGSFITGGFGLFEDGALIADFLCIYVPLFMAPCRLCERFIVHVCCQFIR